MATKSIFSRGGDGMTTGGLDGYLGPEAGDHSSLPPSIENPKEVSDGSTPDCSTDPNNPLCQIARAEADHDAKKAASNS